MPSTSEQQLLLELVNDARLNPLRNARRYISSYSPTLTSSDLNIQSALTYFGVSGALLQQQLQALTPAEPLAWSDILQSTATAHSQAMIDAGLQSHQVPGEQDLGTRVLAAGYNWRLLGENIFAYAFSELYTHAAFMIDWGGSAATGGMQSPPGHRLNIMNPSFREIGIGIIASNGNGLGPLVVTEDLGTGGLTDAFILGVAYNDRDHNDFYSIGEGVSDLSISVPSASATSGSSGGYTLSTTATAQMITLSGAGLAAPVLFSANLSNGHNYKIDVIDGHVLRTTISGTISGPVDVVQGLGMTGLSLTISGDSAKTLIGTPGNDTLNGGDGLSTAVYNVASSAAVLSRNSFGNWTVSAGADGVDTLLNIDRVQFPDRVVPLWVQHSDFNGDHTSDVLLRNGSDAMVNWIVSNGAVTGGNFLGSNPGWNPVGTGDLNSDGVADILMQNSAGDVVHWTMQNGAVASGTMIGNTVGYDIVGMGDFNGDGTEDILLQNGAGDVVDWILNNGQVVSGNYLGTSPGWDVVGTGDFDGDGTTDVLLKDSVGNVVDWTMQNGTVASGEWIGNTVGYDVVGIGDFNGDATSDILLQNLSGEVVDWIVQAGAITSGNYLGANPGWSVVATGDYQGDGVNDVLLANSNGTTVAWTMQNGIVTAGAVIGNTVGFAVQS